MLSKKDSEAKKIEDKYTKNSLNSSLLEAGRQLKERRYHLGISLRELSLRTLISTQVLEAIEEGWVDRLPEPAYLATMLKLLEKNLNLLPGSLNRTLEERV